MALRALRAAVLALLPSLALAQTTATITPTEINRAECTAGTRTVTLTWIYAAAATGDFYRLAAQTSCGTVPAKLGANAIGDDVGVTSIGGNSQTQTVTVSGVRTAFGSSLSCTSNSDTPIKICIYYIPASGGSTPTAASGDFNFQTALPPAPVNVSARPGNEAIEVSFSAGTPVDPYNADTSKYAVEYATQAAGPFTQSSQTSTSPVRISPLTNGTTYLARVVAFSSAGNQGPASDPSVSATPLPFDDYWTRYKDANGQEQGGCGAGGAGALATLLLALAVFVRRRG